MKLTNEEYELLYKKLEYRFKKSGNELVNKIMNKKSLSDDDIRLLLRKLEYTFRKSNHNIIKKLSDSVEEDYIPVKYSNLKAKRKRDEKEKQKEAEMQYNKLKNIKNFDNFDK